MSDFVFEIIDSPPGRTIDPLAALEVDLAYAAGIVDGEGTIGITVIAPSGRRRNPSVRAYVAVSMTDPIVPVWLAEQFGGTAHTYESKNPKHRAQTRWMLQSKKVADFLSTILPYMKTKKPQAELIIRYYMDSRLTLTERTGNVGTSDEEMQIRLEYAQASRTLNGGGQ